MAEASPPTKTEALSNIDPRYLGEYVEFSGQIREYVNDTLGKAFRTDPNPVRRSHHIISLVQLEYAAYEDAAAILKALISTRQGKTNTVLEVLESYKPGEAVLASVLAESSAETAEKLYAALRLEEAIPAEWASWLPSLDLKKSLLLACRFFVSDCRANQKELGVAAYNKSKHGPLVIAKGDLLVRHSLQCPLCSSRTSGPPNMVQTRSSFTAFPARTKRSRIASTLFTLCSARYGSLLQYFSGTCTQRKYRGAGGRLS